MKFSTKLVLTTLICFAMLLSALSFTVLAADQADVTFSYVMMNVGADETERNITWYSNTDADSYVLYGKSGDTELERADAVCTESVTEGYYSCKATLTGLEAGEWIYRLVTGETSSEDYSFKVYDTQSGYSFAFIADAQVQTASHKTGWSDTVNKLMTKFSDVSFMVSAGDQVTTNNSEEQYGYFITPELAKIATATTVGEVHDDHAMYNSHFNLPNLSTEYGVSAASSNYYYRYSDTLFIHINVDNLEYAKHLEYITKIVGENPDCTWKIVVVHYSFFSGGDHSGNYYEAKFSTNLVKGMADLGIDVVLSGHDHVYARSNLMLDETTVSSDVVTDNSVTDPKGVLYLCGTSASGSKFYDVNKEQYTDYIAYRNESNRKGATVFDVTDTTLTMNSYFLDGAEPELMDTFTIVKETEVAPEYDLVVTVDGIVKHYSDVTNFWTVLTEYTDAAYAGKKVEFKLLDDLVFTSAGNLKPATGCSYSIDLAGHTLTESANARIYLQRKNFAINIYSSKKGGEFIFANSSDCFQPDVGCSIVFGSEKYKDTLTVSANNYFINMSAIANNNVMEVKFLNCTVNCGGYGLLRLNALGGGVATLKVEITGCDINGSTSLVFYNSSTSLSADKNGGVFSKDSYINCTDSSFTRTSTNPKNFFDSASTNITDRYFGTVNFDNCSFDTYIINGDVLYSDEALSYNTYYSTLTGYDPSKTVTVGEGCVFTNYGTTFNSAKDDFTANNVNLAKNCKLVSEGSSVKVVLDNTVTIDIGARSADTNVRFVEINGKQELLEENGDKYTVTIGDENLLIEITEKTNAETAEIVTSAYYFVDVNAKTSTKLDMDSYMTTDGTKTIRVKDPMGIRFKYSALTSAKAENDEFVIDEIGFIVAVTEVLGDEELTLDFSKYVTGVAYKPAENKDIVFDSSDDTADVFTCVVKNIPTKEYKTNLTCKTYTKITVGGKQYILYGEAVVGNIYDTALELLKTDPKNADLMRIVLAADNMLGIDGEGLFD